LLMDDWREATLGELYEFSSGLSKPRSEFGAGYPFLSFKDVFYNTFVPAKLTSLVKSDERDRERCSVSRGDVFLTRTSETMDELGMSCVALRDVPNATFNGFTKRLRLKNPSSVVPEYAGYYFRSPSFRLAVNSMSSMSTRASLNNEMLARLKMTLPPLRVQEAIGGTLKALDDKIELNRRMNETLEAMARAIFKDWFVDFGPTRAKIEGRAPYLAPDIWSLFPDRLDDDGKPEGWGIKTLRKIADDAGGRIRTGPFGSQLHQADYVPLGTPVVMPANLISGEIVEHGIARIGSEMASKLSDHAMEEGDIVYGRRGDIGRKALIGSDEAGWICGTGCLRISIRSSDCPPLYLFYHLDRSDIREWIFARAVGATMPNLNTGILGEVEVLVPTSAVVDQLVRTLDPILQKTRENRRENRTLTLTRDLLLPKLMSGEIRVKDAEALVGEVA